MPPSRANVHLVLLIHGLWGCPAHLSVAKEELEAAWVASHSAASTPRTPRTHAQVSGPAEDPVITKTLQVPTHHAEREKQEELVIMIAGGMTSQLTYDGIDVCASRVAWEVRLFRSFLSPARPFQPPNRTWNMNME